MGRTGTAFLARIVFCSNTSAHEPVSTPIEMKTFAGEWDGVGPDYEWAIRLEMEPGSSIAFLVVAPRVPEVDERVYVLDTVKASRGEVHFKGKDTSGKLSLATEAAQFARSTSMFISAQPHRGAHEGERLM
jgi:hypothetical protein